MQQPRGWLLAIACAICSGCVTNDETLNEDESPITCTEGADVYTPYTTATHPMGSVASLPWRGPTAMYPAGDEDFRDYAAESMVECGSNKAERGYVDVTAGCLQATADHRGRIQSTAEGAYRSLALGYDGIDTVHPVKWTDMSVSYRFFYTQTSGPGVLPGFKAFARYRTEYDLYVASWRVDGVVQIQKKQCGEYTPLKILKDYGAPSPNTWHQIRFDTIGDKLELFLDGTKVISITDQTFSWGTAGIRTDAMTGALIDDWRVTSGVGTLDERAEHERPVGITQ